MIAQYIFFIRIYIVFFYEGHPISSDNDPIKKNPIPLRYHNVI